MKQPRIGIIGAAMCGNIGDDLIAYVLKSFLIKGGLTREDVVIVPNPRDSINDIVESDLIIIGGGGLIYDYDMANVDNYCNVIHTANNYRIPVIMVGMGVQHIFSEEAKEKYRKALPIVKLIITRGEEDSEIIRNELNYQGELVTSRDLVFLYDENDEELTDKVVSDKKKLTLSLSDWQLGENYEKIKPGLSGDYESYRNYIETRLPDLKSKYECTVLCQAREDQDVSKRLAELLGTEVVYYDGIDASKNIIKLFRQSDLVITNRYHGFISAVMADTPVIAASFKGHKTQRLIIDSFPSLVGQYFEVDQFVKSDIIDKIIRMTDANWPKTADLHEKEQCIKIAKKHDRAIKVIAGEMYKIFGGV